MQIPVAYRTDLAKTSLLLIRWVLTILVLIHIPVLFNQWVYPFAVSCDIVIVVVQQFQVQVELRFGSGRE